MLATGFETHARERAVDELLQAAQAAAEQVAGAAVDADGALAQHRVGKRRRVQAVAKFMGQFAQFLGVLITVRELAQTRVLGDGAGDRLVEAAVENAEILGRDRRAKLAGELGDRLTDIAVAMHHLADAEAPRVQLGAVGGGTRTDVAVGRFDAPQQHHQLIEKQRHAVADLIGSHERRAAPQQFLLCPCGELGMVLDQEIMEHEKTLQSKTGRSKTVYSMCF